LLIGERDPWFSAALNERLDHKGLLTARGRNRGNRGRAPSEKLFALPLCGGGLPSVRRKRRIVSWGEQQLLGEKGNGSRRSKKWR